MREMGFISKIKAGGEWAKEGMGIEDGEGEGGGGRWEGTGAGECSCDCVWVLYNLIRRAVSSFQIRDGKIAGMRTWEDVGGGGNRRWTFFVSVCGG